MSFNKPIPKSNGSPVRRYMKVKSGNNMGWVEYYIKPETKEGKGETVKVDLSKKGFIVLDNNLFSISGYNEPGKFQVSSNEVRQKDERGNILDEVLHVVKYKDGKREKLVSGPYSQIKEMVKSPAIDGNYTKCIYLMSEDGEIDHLQLHGVGYAAFLENIEKNDADIHRRWIKITGWEHGKRGIVEYEKPIFAYGDEITAQETEKASELCAKVDTYLDGYMSRGGSTSEPEDLKSQAEPFDTKNWREFKEEGKPQLGSLTIGEIQSLKLTLESTGDVDSDLYNCCAQATYDYQQILKTGSWKEKKNAEGVTLEKMSLSQVKEALAKISIKAPSHSSKIFAEAAIECKQAEAGPAVVDVEVLGDDDDVPF